MSLINKKLRLTKKQNSVLRHLTQEIHKSGSTLIAVTSSYSKISAFDLAEVASLYLNKEKVNIAIINFSNVIPREKKDSDILRINSFIQHENYDGITILIPDINGFTLDFLSSKEFQKNINHIDKSFDFTFLCTDSDDNSLLRALENQKVFHILMAKLYRSKKKHLNEICSLLPVQGLLHD